MDDPGDPNWLAEEAMEGLNHDGELLEDNYDNAETFGDMEDPAGEFDFEQGNREFEKVAPLRPVQDHSALNDFDPGLGKSFGIDREQEYFKDPELDLRLGGSKSAWDAQYLSGSPHKASTWSFQGQPPSMPQGPRPGYQQPPPGFPPGFAQPGYPPGFVPPGFPQHPPPQQHPHPQQPPRAGPRPGGSRAMTVEELEHQFQSTVTTAPLPLPLPLPQQQQQQQQQHVPMQLPLPGQQQPHPHYQQQPHPHYQQQRGPQQPRGPWGGNQQQQQQQRGGPAQMTQIMQEEQVQYEKRQRQSAASIRQRSYNGLMTLSDKKLITRIQLLQLQTDNPYLDDFYFQAFSRRESDSSRQLHALPKLKPLPFLKPKTEAVTAEGALGIIPRHSVNRPRMLVQLQEKQAEGTVLPKELKNPLDKPRSEKILSKTKQIKVLKAIETVYDTMLALEDINYHLPQLPEEERSTKFEEMANLVHQIEVQITTPVEGMTKEEYILHFVRYPKGPKILRRALPLLSHETLTTYFFSLLKVFDQLNILDPQSPVEHVAAFLRGVMQPLSPVIEQLNLSKISEALEIIVGHSLFGVFSIARSKVGLTLFEMMFVRAEQIKLSEHPDAKDLEAWRNQFGIFFTLLESNYTSLLTITEHFLSAEIWTFFILLSIHSGPDQRFALLSEIRDRVMEVVRSSMDPAAKQPVFQLLMTMGINPQDLQ